MSICVNGGVIHITKINYNLTFRRKVVKEMTVYEFVQNGFSVDKNGENYLSLAAEEMRRQGWVFSHYDENGNEVYTLPEKEGE